MSLGLVIVFCCFWFGWASESVSRQLELNEYLLRVKGVFFFELCFGFAKCTFRYTYHVTTCLPFAGVMF